MVSPAFREERSLAESWFQSVSYAITSKHSAEISGGRVGVGVDVGVGVLVACGGFVGVGVDEGAGVGVTVGVGVWPSQIWTLLTSLQSGPDPYLSQLMKLSLIVTFLQPSSVSPGS